MERKIASNGEITPVKPIEDQWVANDDDNKIQRPFGLRKMLQGNKIQD